MIILIAIVWYLIGCVGGGYLSYKVYPEITIKDTIFLLTIGGIGGLITFCIGLTYLDWGNKKLF